MRRSVAIVAFMAVLANGCTMFTAIEQRPTRCIELYSDARCLAMMDVAAAEVSRNRGDVTAIAIVPDPTPADGLIQNVGGARPILVRVGFADGTTHDARMCGGLAIAPACSDDPHLRASSIAAAGYTDVPCAGEAPDSCATPHPSLEPAAVADAAPLTIDERTIAIDRVGPFEVVLGEASLPNGILTATSFEFADPWPSDVALADGTGFLEVRSLEPEGKPFDNYYMHGWGPGVERVEAVVRFDVLWFRPGAVLGIRNVVVR
jgi:hypothetical protein